VKEYAKTMQTFPDHLQEFKDRVLWAQNSSDNTTQNWPELPLVF